MGTQKWSPCRHMERLHRREDTRGKRGITQEEVSLGIERGKGYKRERSPLILIIPVMSICDSQFDLEHVVCLASLQHCLVH